PLFDGFLAMPALSCLLAGLVALLLGFLWLDGTIGGTLPFFAIASVLLGIGFALAVWCLGGTLIAGWPLPLPARFVAVGLAGLALTATLGITFALILGGIAGNPYLVDLAARGIPIHAIAGLGGWLTVCAAGVSYRLFAMFLLAPELERRGTRFSLHLAACALVIGVPGGILAVLSDRNLDAVMAAAGAAG